MFPTEIKTNLKSITILPKARKSNPSKIFQSYQNYQGENGRLQLIKVYYAAKLERNQVLYW